MSMPSRRLFAAAVAFASIACNGQVAAEVTADAADDSTHVDTGVDTPPPPDAILDVAVDTPVDAACSMPGMCTLVPASCCGTCGAATPSDRIALPRESADAYRKSVCASSACPACATQQDPNLQAFCVSGSCVPVNLKVDPESACASDADCVPAYTRCCGACTNADLVAVNKTTAATLLTQICDPRLDCASTCGPPPLGAGALCDPTTKHCTLYIGH